MTPDKITHDATFAKEDSERRWTNMILSSQNIMELFQNIGKVLTEAGESPGKINDIVRYIEDMRDSVISRAEPVGVSGRIAKGFSSAVATLKSIPRQTWLKDTSRLLGINEFGILKKTVDLCAAAAPGVNALIYLAEQAREAGMIKENELQNIKEYCKQSRVLFGDKRASTPIDALRRATTSFRSRLGEHQRIIPLSEGDIPEPFLTRLKVILHKE